MVEWGASVGRNSDPGTCSCPKEICKESVHEGAIKQDEQHKVNREVSHGDTDVCHKLFIVQSHPW